MKYFICAALLVLVLSCQPDYSSNSDLCITDITIIDPIDGQSDKKTVSIKDGKIVQITDSSEKLPKNPSTVVDGTGKFLIPGLWDAHVHFDFLEAIAPRMLDLFFCYGITSVRDIGGRIDVVHKWRNEALKDPESMPTVKIAGPLLDGMPNVYDGSSASNPPLSVGLATVEDVAQMIDSLLSLEVDLLKAYEMLTPDQFDMVIKRARENNLKVTGHVPLSMDVIGASKAGLNSMEHLRNLELSCATNSDELLEERRKLLFEGFNDPGSVLRSRIHAAQRQVAVENYDEGRTAEVLNVLAENDTWQIPTMALNTASVQKPFADPQFQESFRYLPPAIAENWKSQIEEFAQTPVSEFRQKYTRWMLDMVKKIHERQIPIMAGTDCPIFFLTPGRSLHTELEVLVQAGMSNQEVLKAATFNPARYFDMEDELGTVSEGKWADLLILDQNPLDDISNTQQINAVIKRGKYHSREDLDERLSRLEENKS